MQPSFAGWPGFYALLDQADVFALYDTAQLSRQSWQTRNRIRQPDGSIVWLSIPIVHESGQLLNETRIDNSRPWRRKHWRTIEACYRRAPHWDQVAWLEDVYVQEWDLLTDLTSHLIERFAAHLGITTEIVRTSDLGSTRAGRIEKLQDFCLLLEATEFLEPASAEYLHGHTEIAPGIPIRWFDHQPKPYAQGGQEWCPYLSIIDLVAHHGTAAISHIRNGT